MPARCHRPERIVRDAVQDRRYLEGEGDDFFRRNFAGADPAVLRPLKAAIASELAEAGVEPRRMLEFGCNYGDLLHHYAATTGAECYGVEPSAEAIAFGRRAYGERIELVRGTIASHPLRDDPALRHAFDLVVVDDVFCWVARETLFQSIASIDDALAEGGVLFVREFLPLRNQRNRNHHIPDEAVYCYKASASHARIFSASGIYEVLWQKTWIDRGDAWVQRVGRDPFESRWCDTILRKSYSDYYAVGEERG